MADPVPESRPRLLDLFCGAGGAAVGYHRAGFEVTGVDIAPQPHYPFDFYEADALGILQGEPYIAVEEFDAIHASPPCQSYSTALRHLAAPQPMLIDPVRSLLVATGLSYVIENVPGAPIPTQTTLYGTYGVVLCGTMFGLRIRRHRLFETSTPISQPNCGRHDRCMNPHNQAGRDAIYAEFGRQNPDPVWNEAMGVPWMDKHEGREAIPPAFTEYIGAQLLAHIESEAGPRG